MQIKTSGGLSNGTLTPKAKPGMLGNTRPGARANIKTTANVRHGSGSMSGSDRRSACDIKTKAI